MQSASREILWNVGSTTNVVLMYSFLFIATVISLLGLFRHLEFWLSGKDSARHLGRYEERFKELFSQSFMQKGVVRDKSIALAHSLIYLGFLVLLFTTSMVFIDHDLGIRIYQGSFYLIVTIFSDIFGLAVIIGCAMIAHRRYILNPDRIHSRPLDWLFLTSIVVLCIQGFLLEGLRIHATQDPWALYSPVGLVFAKFFWFTSKESASLLHFIIWWFHTISVFAVLAIFPYSKFFHILASSLNIYFRDRTIPNGKLNYPGDLLAKLEAGEDFTVGTASIKDYSWKMLMDLDACTSCGRCQEACPAYNSGKVLSPKWLILDTRNHGLLLNSENKITPSILPKPLVDIDAYLTKSLVLKGSGVSFEADTVKSNGSFRAKNELVQNSVLSLGQNVDARIAGEVMEQDVFWSCTTCNACVTACPVGINHIDQIIENRRNMVLMHGEIPSEAQSTLRSIETRGNPYGAAEDRGKWYQDLDVNILKPGDQVEYLYWVGCISAYDQRKQKIARSMVKILNASGLSWGILGNRENCTGDPARRLGEEMLFQNMAKQNIEILKDIRFKKIVANCPHCFNTLKNEYADITGETFEVVHHSQLISKLLSDETLKVKDSTADFTFHDPCYLGRHNNEYEAPRKSLTKIKGLKIIEMEQTKSQGMCCGAGGGHFWFDQKVGQRINTIRAEQAIKTEASAIATACPFCLQMMEDGLKLNNNDEMIVRDIAEVVADQLL